ncbi:methylated-DNA--[protein]-cysteine S-methyltransferase [Ornithinimicrobium humiphilum]|uniref:Methylated-DNA--protein-cysteine methyltransferase n=1 Tax=Ornithinimicrobium humiphilum TaxID=125288 RepID=A0A543KKF6_9MICO|nr:methylated-DNA--[protein]-cysteine S-methyltransferase [Ornithinimicrobium humiphilum]TQM95569.1 methylated-DNA-[protein]-cysteine S-methyltransferase [Ornithinimicrobium humiphilum]
MTTATRSALEHLVVDSPVGPLTLVTDGTALVGLYFAEHRHAPGDVGRAVDRQDAPAVLVETAQQLEEYFAGTRTDFDLPVAATGTDFQHRVWARLREIPYGQTRSYGQLAAELGSPGASRAVGLANGRNPVSIVVPCHRVVGSTGAITGYGGGVERKQQLLDLERRTAGAALF